MSTKRNLLSTAVAAAIGISLSAVPISGAIAAEKKVKCYGVTKAGKNDCGTAKHACAAQATKDYDPAEWKYMSKKACDAAKKKLKKS